MAIIHPSEFKLSNGRILTIRSILPEDAEEFLKFRRQMSVETTNTYHYEGMPLPSVEETKKRLQSQVDDKFTINIGVFNSKNIVGFLNFRKFFQDHPWTEHVAEFGMGIAKEYWGNGIGKRLLGLMEEYAKKNQITRIEATVRAKNERGLKLYSHFGFRIEGTRVNDAKINGEYQSSYSIAKILDDPKLNWKPPTLETERLILRAIELSDAESIFAYTSNPEVSKFTTWLPHRSIQDTKNFINEYVFKAYSKGYAEPLAITLKENPQKVIGTVGCFVTSVGDRSMEIAYALAEEYWGKGIVVEASKKLIEFCIREHKPKRIQARCVAENKGSARVMEKIGMIYEGEMKSSFFRKGRFWDMKIYGMVLDEKT